MYKASIFKPFRGYPYTIWPEIWYERTFILGSWRSPIECIDNIHAISIDYVHIVSILQPHHQPYSQLYWIGDDHMHIFPMFSHRFPFMTSKHGAKVQRPRGKATDTRCSPPVEALTCTAALRSSWCWSRCAWRSGADQPMVHQPSTYGSPMVYQAIFCQPSTYQPIFLGKLW